MDIPNSQTCMHSCTRISMSHVPADNPLHHVHVSLKKKYGKKDKCIVKNCLFGLPEVVGNSLSKSIAVVL
jgi:hypothetical protein